MSKNYFEFQFVIGRGGFGKVWQVVMKKNNKKYALKEMSKVKIIDKRSIKNIKGERDFLSKLRNPFLVNMICAFQDYENLYLVMDLLTGGDLRYHLCKRKNFTEEETKFFISCLLLGLEYIHKNNIIHRDIKPENLVLDENGYARITDFGVAKICRPDNSSETSGTPGYMAPEVLMARNHSFPVDFFAIGIMGYEFMLGHRPYVAKSRKEMKHLVLRKQAKIEEKDNVKEWSKESLDFINKCLKRKESNRLGYSNGVQELKEHYWFKDVQWEELYNKKERAPFVPKLVGNFDKKYCKEIEKVGDETLERYQNYMENPDFENIFVGYTFINYELTQITLDNNNESNTRVTTHTKQNIPAFTTSNSNNNNNNDKKKLINHNGLVIPLSPLNHLSQRNILLSPRGNNKNKYNLSFKNMNMNLFKNNNNNLIENEFNPMKNIMGNINSNDSNSQRKFKIKKKNLTPMQLSEINKRNSNPEFNLSDIPSGSNILNKKDIIKKLSEMNIQTLSKNKGDEIAINNNNKNSNYNSDKNSEENNNKNNLNNILNFRGLLCNKKQFEKIHKYFKKINLRGINNENKFHFFLPKLNAGEDMAEVNYKKNSNYIKFKNKINYDIQHRFNKKIDFSDKIILSKNNFEKINKYRIIKRSESTGYLSGKMNNLSCSKRKEKKNISYKYLSILSNAKNKINLSKKKIRKNVSDFFYK